MGFDSVHSLPYSDLCFTNIFAVGYPYLGNWHPDISITCVFYLELMAGNESNKSTIPLICPVAFCWAGRGTEVRRRAAAPGRRGTA
jgi:hypothetical protein